MHISTNSIASLFKELQSAVGATASAGAGALQDLLGTPASSTGSSAATASVAPTSLSASSPASQFSSQLLSALIAVQSGGSGSATASTSPASLGLSQADAQAGASHASHRRHSAGLAADLRTLGADASSAVQATASIAAGLLASV